MKKILLILAVMVMAALSPGADLYIGDPVDIKIKNTALSEDELKTLFAGFEIEKITAVSGGYNITVRSFETGKKEVKIGNKVLLFNIKSAAGKSGDIDDADNSFIKNELKELKRPFPVILSAVVSGIAAILVLIFILFRKIGFIGRKKLEPYKEFIKIVESAAGPDAPFSMTYALKYYLNERYGLMIYSLTASEIMAEAEKRSEELGRENIRNIYDWLNRCDYLKFGGVQAEPETINILKKELVEMVGNFENIAIEKDKERKQKGKR